MNKVEKIIMTLAVITSLVLSTWISEACVSHDQGEAYEIYTEQLKELGRWPDPDGWRSK